LAYDLFGGELSGPVYGFLNGALTPGVFIGPIFVLMLNASGGYDYIYNVIYIICNVPVFSIGSWCRFYFVPDVRSFASWLS